MTPEMEFILGPGWKIAVVVFAGGIASWRLVAMEKAVRSFEHLLYGKNGDGPGVVTNRMCLEREQRIHDVVGAATGAFERVEGKVDDLRETVGEINGRLRVVETWPHRRT